MKKRITVLLFFVISLLQAGGISLISVNGIINPASDKYISDNILEAGEQGRSCVIIELDTPGGLMTSMRHIIKTIMASDIPVIVYVAPSGAQAASAGVFITACAHVAAMAPGTNIGAAHPVTSGGGLFGTQARKDSSDTMIEKVTNDAVATIQSIADERGRNREWLKDAVIHSVSVTETEALKLRVIDLIARDRAALLDSLDNRTVTVAGSPVVLHCKGEMVHEKSMSWKYQLLDILSHPNVAYLLMMLGFYGLFFEISSPGRILPGVLGLFFLILAFYAFQILPVNFAGIALILLGIILFVLEIKIISYGMLTIGGIVAMIIGSLMLFDSPDPVLRVSWSIIIPSVIFAVLLFGVAVKLVVKAMKNKPVTGFEGLVGETGETASTVNANGGTVFINGEIWKAVADEEIPRYSQVEIMDVTHLVLHVKKI